MGLLPETEDDPKGHPMTWRDALFWFLATIPLLLVHGASCLTGVKLEVRLRYPDEEPGGPLGPA